MLEHEQITEATQQHPAWTGQAVTKSEPVENQVDLIEPLSDSHLSESLSLTAFESIEQQIANAKNQKELSLCIRKMEALKRQEEIQNINQSILTSTDAKHREQLIKVQRELLEASSRKSQQEHQQYKEIIDMLTNKTLGAVAFLCGTALVSYGVVYPGLFMIGASLYPIAPKFVMKFFRMGNAEE